MAQKSWMAAYLLGASFLPTALYADGLPTAPNVVSGAITVTNPSGGQLLVQQSGQYGIINWGTFSIDQGKAAQFNNGAGVTLNRVTGGQLSSILGSLTATGSVYLVNPNGIVIGKTGVVNTGGRFVATTLDVADADLLDGGDMTLAGASDAYVVNLGAVSSMGGDVALVARHVVNQGTLAAPNGTVGLVAGRQVLIRDASVDDGMFAVLVGGADTSVEESGAIRAAAAELRANGGNVYALAGNTSGTIEAVGVAKVNGRVFLTAGDTGKLTVAKPVKAKNADGTGGVITAHGATVDLSGTLDASGTQGGVVRVTAVTDTHFDGEVYATGGSGGFVEISGGHLSFAGNVNTGGGILLIDPDNIEITDNNASLLDNSTQLTTATVTGLLATNNLILQTNGLTGQAGTIVVSSNVFWSSAFSLTLLAQGDVWFNASVQNSNAGGGDLNIVAGWDGVTGLAAFDPSVYDAAALASQTLFGTITEAAYTLNGVGLSASGSVVIGNLDGFNGIAVGSKNGATRVYANDLTIQGSQNISGFGGFAELGYNTSGGLPGGTIAGAINVRAKGDINIVGGSESNSGAQIGHVGTNTADSLATTAVATGSISVEALGNLLLEGGFTGTNSNAYAMIGHGELNIFSSQDTSGARSGNITLVVGGEVSLQQGDFFTNEAWIGHRSGNGTISASDITLTAAAIDASAVTIVGPGGMGTMDIRNMATDTAYGNIRVTTTDSGLTLTGTTALITCECASINSTGNFIVQTSGDIGLDAAFRFSNTGGGGFILAAGGNVQNAAGALAIGTMAGQWNLYSNRPDADTGTLGVLAAVEINYGVTYDPANPLSNPGVLFRGLVYRVTPHLVFDPETLVFGTGFTPTGSRLQVDGVTVNGAAFGITWGVDAINPLQVSTNADGNINVGTYLAAIQASFGSSTAAAATGYQLDWGTLSVTPATVTVSLADQTKPYDGVGGYTGTITYAGFLGTDTAALISGGPNFAYAGSDGSGINAGAYIVTASGTVESSGNYVFNQTDTAKLQINRLTLTAAIGGVITKTYDGTTAATLTPGDFLLTGFVLGEGATVDETAGTYASANASTSDAVSSVLGAADFIATGTTRLGNYVLPVSATGNGVIDRAVVTASIVNDPTKAFDGTTTAFLTSGNYALNGFVAGQGAQVTQTVGAYDSPNAGARIVTAGLSVADFNASLGTLLSNYILPTIAQGVTVEGAGQIGTSPTLPVVPVRGLVDSGFPTTPLGFQNGPSDVLQTIDTETTQAILDEINAGANFCRQFVQKEYAIDCLSDRLQAVADGLSATGEYSEVKAALGDAARKLHAVAVANASSVLGQKVARSTSGPVRTSSRPLTAVSAASLVSANAQASAIIVSTQLVLLRSAANSERKRVAFEQVGQVLGSTKVLLRSS